MQESEQINVAGGGIDQPKSQHSPRQYWRPKVFCEVNSEEHALVTLKSAYVWQAHAN